MAHEHRVVVDIRPAQVQHPSQVVQRGDPVVGGAFADQGLAQSSQLVGARGRCVRQGVFKHRDQGRGRTLGPDGVHWVLRGDQGPVFRRQRIAQRLGQGQAQHRAVHRQLGLRRHHVQGLQPAHISRHGRAFQLEQGDATASQFGLGLLPVAAVGEQGGLLLGHDQGAGRAGEAAQPFARLPAVGQVLGQMRVAAGHQAGLPALLAHVLTQGRKALGSGRRSHGPMLP